MTTQFIGIDPGERWLGIAGLFNNGMAWTAQALVVDLKQAPMYNNVSQLGRFTAHKHAVVVCEEYRPRPQGHNRFSKHSTLRLIGAIEYMFADQAKHTVFVPPQTFELSNVLFGQRTWRDWQERWGQHGSPRWDHALSAWKALAYYLVRHQQNTAHALQAVGPFGFNSSKVLYQPGWTWNQEKHVAPALWIPLATTG